MSQIQNVIHAFIESALADSDISQSVPGGWHHGKRLRNADARPYGMINVEELEREYNTGFNSLAKYRVELTIYGTDKVGVAGATQQKVADVFDLALSIGTGSGHGKLLVVMPIGGSITEDDDQIHGKDVVLSKKIYRVTIKEEN